LLLVFNLYVPTYNGVSNKHRSATNKAVQVLLERESVCGTHKQLNRPGYELKETVQHMYTVYSVPPLVQLPPVVTLQAIPTLSNVVTLPDMSHCNRKSGGNRYEQALDLATGTRVCRICGWIHALDVSASTFYKYHSSCVPEGAFYRLCILDWAIIHKQVSTYIRISLHLAL
jgi:hypothetical protein